MELNQALAPVGDKPAAAVTPGQGGSALTDGSSAAAAAAAVGGAGASEKPAWMDQLADDLKGDEGLTKFKTISDLGKSYKELEGRLSKSVTIPDEKASDEDRAKYRKATGVPEKPEDYKLDPVELPTGINADEQRTKEIMAIAHKHNVPQAAINAIYKAYMTGFAKDIVEAQKIVKITKEEATAKLRTELKADYDGAMSMKDRAFKYLAGEGPDGKELVDFLDTTGLGNHPVLVKLFAKIGKTIGDHAFVDGSGGTPVAAPQIGKMTDADVAGALWPAKK